MINNRDDNWALIINRGLYVNVYQNWRFCSISSLSYLGVISRVGSLKKYDVASRNENDSYISHRKFNSNYIHLCICASHQLVAISYI